MLVAVRMAAPSSSLPCAGARNAARGKSLLLAYLKEIVGYNMISGRISLIVDDDDNAS